MLLLCIEMIILFNIFFVHSNLCFYIMYTYLSIYLFQERIEKLGWSLLKIIIPN